MPGLLPVALDRQHNRIRLLGLPELCPTLLPQRVGVPPIEAIGANRLEPALRHVPEHALEKLLRRHGQELVRVIPMIPIPKRHRLRVGTHQPPVGERAPFDVAGQIREDAAAMPVALPLDTRVKGTRSTPCGRAC